MITPKHHDHHWRIGYYSQQVDSVAKGLSLRMRAVYSDPITQGY